MRPRKKQAYPLAIEQQYAARLVEVANTISRSYIDAALDAYKATARMDNTAEPEPEPAGWMAQFFAAMLAAEKRLGETLTHARRVVKQFAGRTSDFHKRQFHQVLRATYGVDIFTNEAWLLDELAAWEAANMALIKSVPQQTVIKLQGAFIDAVRNGKSLPEVKALVKDVYGVNAKRAELIARDQIGKLNGQLTAIRQQAIGVEKYTWKSMDDSRVRPSHQDYDGQTFKWSEPPPEGHPGQPIRCRCYAAPVLPAFNDINGVIVSQEHVRKAAKESFYDYAL